MDDTRVALLTRYDRQLEDLGCRLRVLLALPGHFSIDPLRATDPESGQFIRESVLEIADGLRTHLDLSVTLPAFARWDTADLGPGIPREQLREVSDGIDELRRVLASSLGLQSL